MIYWLKQGISKDEKDCCTATSRRHGLRESSRPWQAREQGAMASGISKIFCQQDSWRKITTTDKNACSIYTAERQCLCPGTAWWYRRPPNIIMRHGLGLGIQTAATAEPLNRGKDRKIEKKEKEEKEKKKT